MRLVIVESPTKGNTISKFLGKDYKVTSSYGHVRDLPRSKLGVDPDKDFEVQYLIPRKASPRVKELKKEAEKADEIVLATDEDREGEAIAWHLREVLAANSKLQMANKKKKKKTSTTPDRKPLAISHLPTFKRIVFHEITEKAIKEALEHPRDIDMHLVDAQQARRVLDRLVGYKLSPFLWKKIMGGLSAGRVQSVALRLIAEREKEIKAFKPETYYSIQALLESRGITRTDARNEAENLIAADLYKINNEAVSKLGIKTEEEANKIVKDLEGGEMEVSLLQEKEVFKNPMPPFITSTLQQAAANRLGFSSKKTMMLAQRLYENGVITYMRTDSVNLSTEALSGAKKWLLENLGEKYATEAGRVFKKKSRLAQEAHEAIRPTNPAFVPQSMGGEAGIDGKDENRLYDLIWRRFMASQMPKASFYAKHVEFNSKGKGGETYIFSANGNTLKFDGFLKIWPTQFVEKTLPDLKEGEKFGITEIKNEKHETEPPPRFNEASLIKTLEKNGIGRPSTYAPTIATILARNYVEKISGRFHPTEIGELVNNMLTEHFPQIVDIDFTARMEEDLDKIAEGKENWKRPIREFFGPFNELLTKKYAEVEKEEIKETTDEICEKCGKPMLVKRGRFGKFLACSGYPECKNTKSLKDAIKLIGMKCPKCDLGDVIEKRVNKGRAKGKVFWGCSRYPDCDYASWTNPLEPAKKEDAPEEIKDESAEKES